MPDLIKQESDGLTALVSPQLLSFPKVRHAFFTRQGGASKNDFESLNFRFTGDDEQTVLRNYDIAAKYLGYGKDDVVRLNQQHTDIIQVIDRAPGQFSYARGDQPVDAAMTNVPGVVLTGFFADCQLVLFYDHKTGSIAAAHAGWRGIQQQIVRRVIDKMGEQYGVRPRDLTCIVGPSICRSCFETDDDVYDALMAVYGESISDFIYRTGEKWHIDLKNITYSQLISCGVPPINIDISSACPCCGDRSLYWSHRRLGGQRRGVHAGMIVLK